eukprot:3209668-Pyramimonas_sp.AAC.1
MRASDSVTDPRAGRVGAAGQPVLRERGAGAAGGHRGHRARACRVHHRGGRAQVLPAGGVGAAGPLAHLRADPPLYERGQQARHAELLPVRLLPPLHRLLRARGHAAPPRVHTAPLQNFYLSVCLSVFYLLCDPLKRVIYDPLKRV